MVALTSAFTERKGASSDFFSVGSEGVSDNDPYGQIGTSGIDFSFGKSASYARDYRFAGEQFDADLGQYFLRARYYNPEVGRFHNRDTFEGRGKDPETLHKYTYVSNNPVNGIDPSGNFTLGEVSAALKVGVQSVGQLAANSARIAIRQLGRLGANLLKGVKGVTKSTANSAIRSVRAGLFRLKIRPASSKVPKNWGNSQLSKKFNQNPKKVGLRWQDPKNKGNNIRIDKGDPSSRNLSQRVDHVVVARNGKVIARDGNPITGSIKANGEKAHIPLNEYITWKTWFAP